MLKPAPLLCQQLHLATTHSRQALLSITLVVVQICWQLIGLAVVQLAMEMEMEECLELLEAMAAHLIWHPRYLHTCCS